MIKNSDFIMLSNLRYRTIIKSSVFCFWGHSSGSCYSYLKIYGLPSNENRYPEQLIHFKVNAHSISTHSNLPQYKEHQLISEYFLFCHVKLREILQEGHSALELNLEECLLRQLLLRLPEACRAGKKKGKFMVQIC